MEDLFSNGGSNAKVAYSAADIEVLEGLEPVRRRPGMYVGGTDETALHHLVAELLDNAMDEAVAGHADRIGLHLDAAGGVTVTDNGRGIPVDDHPKFPGKSALEVILTTLHSGGKFKEGAYATAGGLHGVGVSVVNALAAELEVEVARGRQLYRQTYRQGVPQGPLVQVGAAQNRRGTRVRFTPDPEIFRHGHRFRPDRLLRMARSKAYLYRGVEIRWSADAEALVGSDGVPEAQTFHFPEGLKDFLESLTDGRELIGEAMFTGESELADGAGRLEWALAWPEDETAYAGYYCNTVPTPDGGSHEQGLRGGLLRGFKAHAERIGQKKAGLVTADDLLGGAAILLSVFIKNPQFQGQTKARLIVPDVVRPIDASIKDRFELWLSANKATADALIGYGIERAEDRVARKKAKEVNRKSATRKLRLPGKLADCAREARAGSELFLVEGDSAGGSAKQARNRETQAVLPLRGKILNAASASADKLKANKEVADLVTALGCGVGRSFDLEGLRYEKVIIMTDADVDGAHIASLLMTFFVQEMRPLVEAGHLFLARPPLYRLSAGGKVAYAADDAEREHLLATDFKNRKVEVSRFKGLGEMNPGQLKETTMAPKTRLLDRVDLPDRPAAVELINELMGRRPELRFAFIQRHAGLVEALDI
ncbi:MAG: DNA topoisomerase IV subunit B [Geminicoccaceae bacterium]|nr:MAG: DNA topoisomerase IV subunit B [Geminicoccaceae bacterium]